MNTDNNDKSTRLYGNGNITPRWKKGQSGNPSGRPKGYAEFAQNIRAFLAGKAGNGKQRMQILIERLYYKDPKTLLAYAFGKPTETHDITTSTVAGVPEEVLERLRELMRESADELEETD